MWSKVATTGTPPAPRHFHNTCVVGRKLWVFAGYDGHAWRNDVVALDLDTLRWTTINAPGERPGVRASGSACVISGERILAFGGYDGSDFLHDLWILHTSACLVALAHPFRARRRHL